MHCNELIERRERIYSMARLSRVKIFSFFVSWQSDNPNTLGYLVYYFLVCLFDLLLMYWIFFVVIESPFITEIGLQFAFFLHPIS